MVHSSNPVTGGQDLTSGKFGNVKPDLSSQPFHQDDFSYWTGENENENENE